MTSITISSPPWAKNQPSKLLCKNRPEACNFIKKKILAQVFSCEFCEISKNTLFTKHLRAIASVEQSTSTHLHEHSLCILLVCWHRYYDFLHFPFMTVLLYINRIFRTYFDTWDKQIVDDLLNCLQKKVNNLIYSFPDLYKYFNKKKKKKFNKFSTPLFNAFNCYQFHTLFWCFHCWLWTSKCQLDLAAFIKIFEMLHGESSGSYNYYIRKNFQKTNISYPQIHTQT